MKTLLLALALAVPMFAESGVKMMFNIQTNTPACRVGTDQAFGQLFGCLSKEFRLAGVMVLAKSSDDTITAFRFTVTGTLEDGTTFKKIKVESRTDSTYVPTVIWIAKEPSEFSNVSISVVGLRDSDTSTSGTLPGIAY